MANEGFKGDCVLVEKLSVGAGPNGAPVLLANVQFASEDGTVHAVAQHSFLLDAEADEHGIASAVSDLLRLITKRVEALHFERPRDSIYSPVAGIAEVMRHALDDDGLGTQG